MADIVCQVLNQDRGDQIHFIWSSGGGFFDPYVVRGPDLTALRTAADRVRDRLRALVVAMNHAAGQIEAIPPDLPYELAVAGFRLFNRLVPSDDPRSTPSLVHRWLKELRAPGDFLALEIVVDEDPDQVERFVAIPWNLVYDQHPAPYRDAFKTRQGLEHWRPFWAIRYNLTSGRRVDPWRRRSEWTEPPTVPVIAVIDPRACQRLDPDERSELEAFLKEFGFEPISAPVPSGRTKTDRVRTVVGSLDELEAALEDGYPRLLYWFGHASPGYLHLGDRSISPADLRDLLCNLDGRDRPEGMLAFLNACQTAEPGSSDSFLHALHRSCFTGAIVTERETIDNFANRFGLKFLRGFLRGGKPLGALLHELRREEMPLGLVYGAHCPPGIRVRNGPGPDREEPEIRAARAVTGHSLGAPASLLWPGLQAEPPGLPARPYRSLAFYDRSDRLLFTGRDADVVRFAMTLDRPDTRILVLHGESGIGKSSFLRAGVIPYLEEECVGYRFLRDRERRVVIIQASRDPVGQLAEGLLEMTEQPPEYSTPNGEPRTIPLRPILDEALGTKADADGLRKALMSDPARLATLLQRLSAALPHALVLVLDQAEELFTLAKEPKEVDARDQALQLLQRTADLRADVKVIVSLRTEYYGRLLDHLRAGRRDLATVRDDLLRDFSGEALIEAIERPTATLPLVDGQPSPRDRYGFAYEPGVAEAIVNGVLALRTENQDSVLPLVQVICTQLYARVGAAPPSVRVVTPDDLEAIGGVKGGLRAFAEDALERSMGLVPEDRDAFKALYTQLYNRQADGTLTTWQAPRANLDRDWNGHRPFGQVLDAAVAVRLLREDHLRIEGGSPQAYVRLGHDALARVADAWNTEREQQRRLDRIRRRSRLIAASLAVMTAISLSILSLAVALFSKNRQLNDAIASADQRARVAEARRLAAQSVSALPDRPQVALLLASEAVQTTRRHGEPAIAAAEMALRESLATTAGIGLGWHGAVVTELADDAKGRLAAGDQDGVVRVWDLNHPETRPTLLPAGNGEGVAVEMLPGGRVATGGEDGVVRLWNLGRPDAGPIGLGKHDEPVLSLRRLPDGRLVSGGADGTVRIWDPDPPHQETRLRNASGDSVHVLAVTADGRLAAGAVGQVRVWNPKAPGDEPITLRGRGGQVFALRGLHDGRLASGAADGLVRIWDLNRPNADPDDIRMQTGAVHALIELPEGRLAACGDEGVVRTCDPSHPGIPPDKQLVCDCPLRTLSVLADGRLVAGGDDGVVRVWQPLRPGPVVIFFPGQESAFVVRGHEGAVVVSSVMPDGRLVSGGADGMVRVWDPRRPAAEPALLPVLDGQIESLGALPGGRLVGGGTHGVVVWERPEEGSPPAVLPGFGGRILAQVALPENRLAVGTGDNQVRIWDLGKPTADPRVLPGSGAATQCFIVTPEGRLVAGGGDGVVRIWDLAHPDSGPERREGHRGPVVALAELPDGRFASGAGDDAVRVWDLNRPPEAGPELLSGGAEEGRALVAMSGGRLASGASDGLVRIWAPGRRRTPTAVLEGIRSPVKALAVSRRGRLVCARDDDTIEIWDQAPSAGPIATLRGGSKIQVLRIGPAERLFVGYGDGSVRVWDLERPGAEPVTLRRRNGAVLALEFSHDDRLVTAGVEGPVEVWDLDLDRLLRLAALRCGRNLTRKEWSQYFPEERPRKTYENLPDEPPLPSPQPRSSDLEPR